MHGNDEYMKPWLKQSLATSLAIALMAKFSITHPPAGAAAMIFSTTSSNMKWSNLGFMLVAYVVAIGIATLVNNMSTKRQYPTSWGIPTSLWLENAPAVPATTSTGLSRRTSLVVPKQEPQVQTQRWYYKFRNNTIIHT
jgi:CBS-domain-containing membrane protein